MSRSGKLKLAAGEKRLLLAGFRLITLSLVLVELAFDPSERAFAPGIVLAVAAMLYTGLKLVQPLRWYTYSSFRGASLIIVDVMVCAALLLAHRVIHTPFALYALNPVLVAALLFPPKVARITGGVTAFFYALNFFSFPLIDSLEHLASMFSIYITALGLTVYLPYAVNAGTQQSLQSRAMFRERLKLGREIHDGLCQMIYGLNWEVRMLHRDVNIQRTQRLDERLKHIGGLLDELEKEARGSIDLLRSFKADRPFLPQLDDSLRHLANEAGIGYRLQTYGGEPHLDDLVKMEVLYICEEALRNVAKHSRAGQVTVRVHAPNGRLRVSIADDGWGMADARPAEGHGLMVMKERAESLGGDFQIVSVPGRGTEIRVEVPMRWSPELQEMA